MIVLDTNVVSELMEAEPSAAVQTWIDRQDPGDVWTTAVTVYEVLLGIELMARGRKRRALEDAMLQLMMRPFKGRILPFSDAAAGATAALVVRRRRAGRPIGFADAQIAGIVETSSAILVTRDVTDFWGMSFPVIDPWTAA
jgi:predicted nucleic acid-binding protein